MLRRPATTIQLTSADLERYEANRQRKNWEKQQQPGDASQTSSNATIDKGKEKGPKSTQKDRIMRGGQGRQEEGENKAWYDEGEPMDTRR